MMNNQQPRQIPFIDFLKIVVASTGYIVKKLDECEDGGHIVINKGSLTHGDLKKITNEFNAMITVMEREKAKAQENQS